MYLLEIGGRRLRFKNKASAMRWSRDQARPYVPKVVPDDIHETRGVGSTFDRKKPLKLRSVWDAR